jgi:hypothetical protein
VDIAWSAGSGGCADADAVWSSATLACVCVQTRCALTVGSECTLEGMRRPLDRARCVPSTWLRSSRSASSRVLPTGRDCDCDSAAAWAEQSRWTVTGGAVNTCTANQQRQQSKQTRSDTKRTGQWRREGRHSARMGSLVAEVATL